MYWESINQVHGVQGSVAPGFESVKQRFEQQTNTLAEDNAQRCVYHQVQKLVDLWSSAITTVTAREGTGSGMGLAYHRLSTKHPNRRRTMSV